MSFRTPLSRVRGLGSAKGGTSHWWAQRVTAVALVPLSLWFVASLIALVSADYEEFVAWVSAPLSTVLLIAFVVAVFHHAQLGLQVVIEDYVHAEWLKIVSLVAIKLLAFLLAVASIYAVLRITFGS